VTCDELKQQAAAYALGALDAAEKAACEQHLAEAKHDGCVEAVRAAAEAAGLLAEALTPAAPSPSTWAAIEGRLRGVAPARRGPPLVAWLLAAAAVLLIVWLGLDRARMQDRASQLAEQLRTNETAKRACVAQLEQMKNDAQMRRDALALLGLSGTQLIALSQKGAEQANVIYHSGQKRAYVLGRNLAAPSGKDYELWVIRGERKIPAGLLRADSSGALIAAVDPALLADGPPDAMAVTLEATGGKPQPEGPIVLVGKI
jgi:anti-sigma-K factor RskA